MESTKEQAYRTLNFAADIGEVLIRNGAETYRVEETIRYVLNSFTGYDGESFVSPTIIICTNKNDTDLKTIVRRIRNRTVNLEKVDRANDLSRRISAKKVTLDDAIKEIEEIGALKNHTFWMSTLMAGLCCWAFAFIFDGGLPDAMAAGLIGLLLYPAREKLGDIHLSNFVADIVGGGIVGALTLLFMSVGLGRDDGVIIISAIMILVPGVTLTNSFRDILEGDYLSGMSRLAEAVFVAVCIAVGVGIALGIGYII